MSKTLGPTRRLLLGAALALPLGLGLTAADAAEPVKIGYAISKTGPFAPIADLQIKAYELWAKQIENQGGLDVAGEKRPIEFVVYDDQSDFGKTPGIYEKLITDDKVDLLLAPWGTPFHFAVAGVLERYGFPMVGNSAASVQLRDLKPGNIWFPTSAIPDRIAAELVKLLQQQGVKTVAVNTLQLPFSQEVKGFLMPALKDAGIEVVVDEEYAPGTRDMTATLTKIKQANPDAILALAYPPDGIVYMTQARELGLDAPVQLLLIGPTASFFRDMFGANLDGVLTVGHWSPQQTDWPKAKPFYDAYVAMYGERPDYLDSALAYTSLEILQQAVAKVGLDHDALRKEISEDTFDTINGPISFKGVENAVTPTMFLQVQGDDLEIVWPPEQATAPIKPKGPWAN